MVRNGQNNQDLNNQAESIMWELYKDLVKLQSQLHIKKNKQINQSDKVVRMAKQENQKLALENKKQHTKT